MSFTVNEANYKLLQRARINGYSMSFLVNQGLQLALDFYGDFRGPKIKKSSK